MLIQSVVVFYVLTTLTQVQEVAATQVTDEVIIEPPENQYILEGAVATLSCRVQGAQYAFWSINEENTTEHRHHWSYYEGLGVVFTNSSDSNSNINLTMTVPASLTSKVNNIRCIAKNENHFILAMSDNVQISVFKSFSPSPPLITVDVIFHPISLYITIKGEPLWPNYEISEFRVNITSTISGSLLSQMITTKNSFINDTVRVQINESLLIPAVSQYYLLTISVSTVSPLYNESKPNQTNVLILGIQRGESKSDASLYKVAMGISLGIALLLMSSFGILVVCFCFHCQRTRQQGVHSRNSLPSRACNTNQRMVTNPIYDPGQVYDSIDPRVYSANNGSPVQAMPRYSYSPSHNATSLDTAPRIQETMTYNTTVHTSSSVIKKSKVDRSKLHLTLPGVPGSDRSQINTESTEAGCVISEEGLYVEMSQSGTLSQQATQPIHVI